jgi:hypothetical protein
MTASLLDRDYLTSGTKQRYAEGTISFSGQPHPSVNAVFLRPKFHNGRDDRPKYKTFGEYASRLKAVVESRLPINNRKASKLNFQESAMTNQAPNAAEIQGQIPPKQTQPEAVSDFLQQIRNLEIERQAVTEAGIPALFRLADIAEGDTGQAATVRRFLLGLYNGHRFPFNLITLRGLDKALFDDCLAVLKLDARATRQEVHQYFDNGGERFERWTQGGEQ